MVDEGLSNKEAPEGVIHMTSNSHKKPSRMHTCIGRLRQPEDICQSEVVARELKIENALLRSVPSDSVGNAMYKGRAQQKVMHGVRACATVGTRVRGTLEATKPGSRAPGVAKRFDNAH